MLTGHRLAFENLCRIFFRGLLSILTASLFLFFSLFPSKNLPQITFPFFDKIVHLLIYCLLSFIVVNTLRLQGKTRIYFFSFSYAFSLGLLLEFIQFFLPYRVFELGDIFFNFLGSILGCFLRFSKHK